MARPLAVHSINRFVFSVPKLEDAERFYQAFGLDPRREGKTLGLYAFGHPHCWGTIHEGGTVKKLAYLSYGIYQEDEDAFRKKLAPCEPHPLSDGKGLWVRDPDGMPTQLVVAPKVSPSGKTVPTVFPPVAAGKGKAPSRSQAKPVRPRYLSHLVRFTPDVPRMLQWSEDVLGLKLSDKSLDIVAFMHSPHGSDHHMSAYAKSNGTGLHHTSWDVGSFHEVGQGAEQMRIAGYTEGWGVGRHVLGSNYFYYARDPWGSYAEYSFDIDYVPAGFAWPAADHPPEDSFYVWGPAVPPDFVQNFEAA
jgi:catechol 2,3-dioxygenase-like lactoylglutathione lyase family enzyme